SREYETSYQPPCVGEDPPVVSAKRPGNESEGLLGLPSSRFTNACVYWTPRRASFASADFGCPSVNFARSTWCKPSMLRRSTCLKPCGSASCPLAFDGSVSA